MNDTAQYKKAETATARSVMNVYLDLNRVRTPVEAVLSTLPVFYTFPLKVSSGEKHGMVELNVPYGVFPFSYIMEN